MTVGLGLQALLGFLGQCREVPVDVSGHAGAGLVEPVQVVLGCDAHHLVLAEAASTWSLRGLHAVSIGCRSICYAMSACCFPTCW